MKSLRKICAVLLVLTVCITAASAQSLERRSGNSLSTAKITRSSAANITNADIMQMLGGLGCDYEPADDGILVTSPEGYGFEILTGDYEYEFWTYWTTQWMIDCEDVNDWNCEWFSPSLYIDEDGDVNAAMTVLREGMTIQNLAATAEYFMDALPEIVDFLEDYLSYYSY